MVKVAVKWNKRVFADVEVTPTVADFKAKLQELTVRIAIPSHRQQEHSLQAARLAPLLPGLPHPPASDRFVLGVP